MNQHSPRASRRVSALYSPGCPAHFTSQITPPAVPAKEQSRHNNSLPFISTSHQTAPASPMASIQERSSSIFPDQNSKSDHLLGINSGGILSLSFHARNTPARKNTAARMNTFILSFVRLRFCFLLAGRAASIHTEAVHSGDTPPGRRQRKNRFRPPGPFRP